MKKIIVGTAAFGCIKGPSGAGKTEIPVNCRVLRCEQTVVHRKSLTNRSPGRQ